MPGKAAKGDGNVQGNNDNKFHKRKEPHFLKGKPTKTNQIHMTLRPKYGDHQVQHTAQDT